ncbi:hypothetical protein TeGR_g10588 [Tetraparma gracilis]|jgi:hypothetical protein|uniref:Uncharacterized protein n=1 Tax=Tetraparma gracilis TaxID=2962635 RepID=A0ABQ6M9D0_9STRA|nr:hypothetical protein TeGR_g10588 [Tetraparma gracilis]
MPFDPKAHIEHDYEPTFENPIMENAFIVGKVLLAVSPLLALAFVLMNAFDDKDEEDQRRIEKEKAGCGGKCC